MRTTMPVTRFLLAALIAVFCAAPAPGGSGPAAVVHRRPSEIYSSIFSIDLATSGEASRDLAVQAGVKWVRATVSREGQDLDALDQFVDEMNECGVNVLLVLGRDGPTDTEGSTVAREACADFARTLAARFAGRVRCYELPDGPSGDRLLVQAVRAHIRAADPDAMLVIGATALDPDRGGAADGIAIRLVTKGTPEKALLDPEMAKLTGTVGGRFRGGPPVWCMEHRFEGATSGTRAKYLARAFLLEMALGFRLSTWSPKGEAVGKPERDIVRNITALFDDTLWHRTDLRCASRVGDEAANGPFLGFVYLSDDSDEVYTALAPSGSGRTPVTTSRVS